jgi:1-acyl-sn-glycerol-3-phosphate acyltransferase
VAELVYPPIIRLAIGVMKGLRLDVRVVGQENVPATGGGVVAMNHVGYVDFILAGVPFWYGKRRIVRFMAKHEVFAHPVAGPLMRGMHHIPVDRSAGAGAYQEAVKALQSGELVGVFPEATISRAFVLKDFKTGAARMAAEAGVPLIPVVLWGSQRLMTKGRKPSFKAARRVPVIVSVGAPMQIGEGESPAEATARLAKEMQVMLEAAVAAYPESPKTEADRWWLPAQLGGTAPTLEAAAELDRKSKAQPEGGSEAS